MQSKDADPERFFGKLKERMHRYASYHCFGDLLEARMLVYGPDFSTQMYVQGWY